MSLQGGQQGIVEYLILAINLRMGDLRNLGQYGFRQSAIGRGGVVAKGDLVL